MLSVRITLAVTSEQRGAIDHGFSPRRREESDRSGFLWDKDQMLAMVDPAWCYVGTLVDDMLQNRSCCNWSGESSLMRNR